MTRLTSDTFYMCKLMVYFCQFTHPASYNHIRVSNPTTHLTSPTNHLTSPTNHLTSPTTHLVPPGEE